MKYPIAFPVSSISSKLSSPSSLMAGSDSSTNTWLTENYYLDGCGGQVIMSKHMSTSTCYETGDSDFPSVMVNCGTNITTTRYTDLYCQSNPTIISSNEQTNYCYSTNADDDGYVNQDGQWAYMQYTCTTGTPQPLSTPSGTKND